MIRKSHESPTLCPFKACRTGGETTQRFLVGLGIISLLCLSPHLLCALVQASDPDLCGRNVFRPLFTSPTAVPVILPLETWWGAKSSIQIPHRLSADFFFTCCVSNAIISLPRKVKQSDGPSGVQLGWNFLCVSFCSSLTFSFLTE